VRIKRVFGWLAEHLPEGYGPQPGPGPADGVPFREQLGKGALRSVRSVTHIGLPEAFHQVPDQLRHFCPIARFPFRLQRVGHGITFSCGDCASSRAAGRSILR
jgi:hypothetical protein